MSSLQSPVSSAQAPVSSPLSPICQSLERAVNRIDRSADRHRLIDRYRSAAALECSGEFWRVLESSGMFWRVLVCANWRLSRLARPRANLSGRANRSDTPIGSCAPICAPAAIDRPKTAADRSKAATDRSKEALRTLPKRVSARSCQLTHPTDWLGLGAGDWKLSGASWSVLERSGAF